MRVMGLMANGKSKFQGRCAVLCILLSVMLFQSACKEEPWEIPYGPYEPPPPPKARIFLGKVTGAAMYSQQDDIYVKFNLSFETINLSGIDGEILQWSFNIKKDGNVLLSIYENNYNDSYFRLSVHSTNGSYSIPGNSTVILTIKHDEGAYTPGYPFGQDVPDNMDVNLRIQDNNGYTHTLKDNVPFSYTPL